MKIECPWCKKGELSRLAADEPYTCSCCSGLYVECEGCGKLVWPGRTCACGVQEGENRTEWFQRTMGRPTGKSVAIALLLLLGCTPSVNVYRAHMLIFGAEPIEADSSVLALFDETSRCYGQPGPARVDLFVMDSAGLYVESPDTLLRRRVYGYHQHVGPGHSRIYIERASRGGSPIWKHEYMHALFWEAGIVPDSTNASHHALSEMRRCTYAVRRWP